MSQRNQVLQYFQTGMIPTQQQFAYAWGSVWFKDEKLNISDISGLETALQNTLYPEQLTDHVNNPNSHSIWLAKIDASNLGLLNVTQWKEKLGIANIATVDGLDEDGNVNTKEQINQIVEELKLQDDETLLLLEELRAMLTSNDINLDELQEVVNYIKENREQIELLQQVAVGNTTDDRITLMGNYANWGVNLQNQLNDVVYDKITTIENDISVWGQAPYRVEITGDQIINHDLDTFDFVCEGYDSVTLYKVPLRVRILNNNSVEIQFDDQPVNPIKITIRKI